MKTIILIAVAVVSMNANAFFGKSTSTYGYGNQEDNGIFAYNPYRYFDPRWGVREMENTMTEIKEKVWDEEDDSYKYGYGKNSYGFAPKDSTK